MKIKMKIVFTFDEKINFREFTTFKDSQTQLRKKYSNDPDLFKWTGEKEISYDLPKKCYDFSDIEAQINKDRRDFHSHYLQFKNL